MLEVFVGGVCIALFISLIGVLLKLIRWLKSVAFPNSEVQNVQVKHDYLIKKHSHLVGQKHKNREIIEIYISSPWSKNGNWKVVGTLKGNFASAGVDDDKTILKIADSELNDVNFEDNDIIYYR